MNDLFWLNEKKHGQCNQIYFAKSVYWQLIAPRGQRLREHSFSFVSYRNKFTTKKIQWACPSATIHITQRSLYFNVVKLGANRCVPHGHRQCIWRHDSVWRLSPLLDQKRRDIFGLQTFNRTPARDKALIYRYLVIEIPTNKHATVNHIITNWAQVFSSN